MRLALPEPLRVDALRVDALRTDAYVESLITGLRTPAPAESSSDAHDAPGVNDALDPAVAAVARLLHATAARPHPSFRFEERVAARLAAVARGASPAPSAAGGTVVLFPGTAPAADPSSVPAHAARSVTPIAGIASAAVASAALSLGAAAVVAWRRGRPRRGIA